MMLRILALVALFSLTGSANAIRVIGQPERPFELTLSHVTLPKDTNGSVTLQEDNYGRVSNRRFVPGAKFLVDGREVLYADFLLVVAELRGNSKSNDTAVANVYVDVTTEKVTRVSIRRPRR